MIIKCKIYAKDIENQSFGLFNDMKKFLREKFIKLLILFKGLIRKEIMEGKREKKCNEKR